MSPLEQATGVDKLTGEKVTERLTAAEADRCDQLETVISKGMETFVEVGTALAAIRDEKLWRDRSTSFANYLEFYWPDIKRAHAYRLMDAAETVAELSPMGDTPLPTSERQARELRPLKGNPEAAADAMRKASEDGPATAKKIAEAVADVTPVPKGSDVMKERVGDLRETDPEIRAAHLTGTLSSGLVDLLNKIRKYDPVEVAAAVSGRDAGRIDRLMNEAEGWFAVYRSEKSTTLRSVK